MSNKKLILCKFIFFIGMCILYSCSWQGLEYKMHIPIKNINLQSISLYFL